MALSTFILLCNSHHHPAPKSFTFLNWNSIPIKLCPPPHYPHPWLLTSTNALSDSMNLTILGTLYVLICFSHVRLCATLWTVACQAPLFMGFSRQEYWSGLPCSSPGDLPDPGIELNLLRLLPWHVGSLPLVPPIMSPQNLCPPGTAKWDLSWK